MLQYFLKSKFSSKQVVHVKLMYDKETSRMRGKCFLVEMIGSENPNVMGKEIFLHESGQAKSEKKKTLCIVPGKYLKFYFSKHKKNKNSDKSSILMVLLTFCISPLLPSNNAEWKKLAVISVDKI